MKSRLLAVMLGVGLLASSVPLAAHHSTAMYNMAGPTVVTGNGKVVTWEVEMMSLNHLKSYGWTRSTVQPGNVISCTGGAAKSGAPAMLTSLVKLNDGRMIKS